jgi:hypothetical protein
MNFKFEGQVYDTSTFQTFETDDRWIPIVWLTSDRAAVFYATVDDGNALEIRRASNADIRRLAERYKLDALRTAQRYPSRGRAPGDRRGTDLSSRKRSLGPDVTAPLNHPACQLPFSFP